MNCRYLLLFLLLGSLAFADTDCDLSYTDNITVRVLDAKSRPVEGASVLVYHQYSGAAGPAGGTYHTIGPKLTDSSGMVNAYLHNIEQSEDLLDCSIDLNASVGGVSETSSVTANSHPNIIDLSLDVYPIIFYVRDQGNTPLENATLTIDSQIRKTDSNGYVKFFAGPGKVNYFVSYLSGKQSGSIDVLDDVTYGINLAFYTITIKVVDDNGNPLNASITIFNTTAETGPTGIFEKNKTFGEEIDFSATYKGLKKDSTMYPSESTSEQVVFDINAPTIGSISKEEIDDKVRLTIPVTDEGLYASGVDPSTISITYRLEQAGSSAAWSKATTYVSSKNTFIADFPEFNQSSLVQFRVEVNDKEGNKATVNGRFTTSTTQPPTTDTNPQPDQDEGGEFPLLPLVGGVLIIAIVLYVFFRFGKKGGEKQQV